MGTIAGRFAVLHQLVKAPRAEFTVGNAKHGCIDFSSRLRAGRAIGVKNDTTRRIFEAARSFLSPDLSTHGIALSLKMRDIDSDLSPKTVSFASILAAPNRRLPRERT